jgi:hypothetical protein
MSRWFTVPLLFLAVAAFAAAGCSSAPSTAPGTGAEAIVFEYEEIDLIPGGAEKQVKVKSGKAESAEAPKDSGVTAKLEGDKLTVSAAKDAKAGTHKVTVKGAKGKEATINVKVKKGSE